MEVNDLLRQQFKECNEWLRATMQGVTPDQAHWKPAGTANPLGASYVHILLTQDIVANEAIKAGAPLYTTTWANKVGVSELPPAEEVTRLGPMGSLSKGRSRGLDSIWPSGANIRRSASDCLDRDRARPHGGNTLRQLNGPILGEPSHNRSHL